MPNDDEEAANSTPLPSSDYRRALYTSDGLTMSSRLLDSLIVQACVDPLVYDTVCALGSTNRQPIPARDWREILRSLGAGSVLGSEGDDHDDEDAREQRSFRVELMLLDVPSSLVGRSFGFLQLLLMLENGWIALGLYRDKRTLATAQFASAEPSLSMGQPESGSPFFVFTNPPPDTLMQRTDRIYTLLQRWLHVDTAEAVLGQSEPADMSAEAGSDHTAPGRAAPPTTASVPSSYSPRVAPLRATPAMPVWTEGK